MKHTLLQNSNHKDIAKFKLPERLELVAEFPLSKMGKVSKQTLIQMAKEMHEQSNT